MSAEDNFKDYKVIHLTFTGYFAGLPFCGCKKIEEKESGALFMHVPYSNIEKFISNEKICKRCKDLWNESENDVNT